VKKTQQTQKELEDELLARVAAQSSFTSWLVYRDAGVVPAMHHLLLIQELERVARGETQNLMVAMPPGSAKSLYTSVEFPPWFIGKNPKASVIGASHTLLLAERFGRRARNIVASRPFKAVFDFTISEDTQAAGQWETTTGAEYFAVGVGGAVTGRRADLAIIDDPISGRDDADSDRNRETVWQWYLNDFLTRLKPGARQVLIMTRWHEDDLAGRLLAREAKKWRVITLPMLAVADDPLGRAPGDRLWPEWFTDEMVAAAQLDTRSWNALYQQNPIPDEGTYFLTEWFGEYGPDDLPKSLNIYAASDYAVTRNGGDFTEHGIVGVDSQGNWYVLDWWRGQETPDVWVEAQCDLILKHEPQRWFGESGVIRKAVEPYLVKRMQERGAYCWQEWLPSVTDKQARARPVQALASMGKIYFPKVARWKADVFGQLIQFPAGRHDDAVDVFSLMGRAMQQMAGTATPRSTMNREEMAPAHAWMG
jgi:predicted phage terminase large subunit-like protein